jgi:hypothetical protein
LTKFLTSTAVLISTVFLGLTVEHEHTFKNYLPGEWTIFSSVNKKYSEKDCSPANTYKFTFKNDGTYIYVTGSYTKVNGQNVIHSREGKYKLDSLSNSLILFETKLMPENFSIPDKTYKIISISKRKLTLNECWCIESEYDEQASDKCETKYKKTK